MNPISGNRIYLLIILIRTNKIVSYILEGEKTGFFSGSRFEMLNAVIDRNKYVKIAYIYGTDLQKKKQLMTTTRKGCFLFFFF